MELGSKEDEPGSNDGAALDAKNDVELGSANEVELNSADNVALGESEIVELGTTENRDSDFETILDDAGADTSEPDKELA